MNEMIDRVAKAQKAKLLEITGGTLPDHLFTFMARASIEAMREPTEDMLDTAGYEPEIAMVTWPDMIGAALK